MPISLQQINVGTTEGDNTGDGGRNAFIKINENSAVLIGALEDAERKAFVIPITAEDAVVAAGDSVEFRIPYSFVLLEVRASLYVEDSTTDVDINITENGSTIFQSGDILTVPSGTTTSVGASPQPDVRYVLLEDNNKIRIVVSSAPSGGTAAGLKVYLIGYVIWSTF